MPRQTIASGRPLEPVIGYSRAVRVGNSIYVAGTTASAPDGSVVGGDDAYLQAKDALGIIATALREAGSSPRDVVRTRVFMKRREDWEAIGRAHLEMFGDVRPASTFVQVTSMINLDTLVEIEADAIVPDE